MNDKLKTIWTERDFDVMNWHDNVIHGFSILAKDQEYELLLDIDYIFDWIQPVPPDNYYSFVVAPATLSFADVWDIQTDIATRKSVLESLRILDIQRLNQRIFEHSNFTTWEWIITLVQGTIKFTSSGYSQYIRRKPMPYETHILEDDQRGPISFSKEEYKDA